MKYGKVACLNVPTIKYRQHDNNTIGSTLAGKIYIYNRLKHVLSWFRVYHDFLQLYLLG